MICYFPLIPKYDAAAVLFFWARRNWPLVLDLQNIIVYLLPQITQPLVGRLVASVTASPNAVALFVWFYLYIPQLFKTFLTNLHLKMSEGGRFTDSQVISMQCKVQLHLPYFSWFSIQAAVMSEIYLFSSHVYVNLGVWEAEVQHAADGEFMAQTGESLQEECWLPDRIKYFLHWIQLLDYYINKIPMLGRSDWIAPLHLRLNRALR